jgi:mRNA-degrading endonuclease HigB of HigAB toxin-antitoxin module
MGKGRHGKRREAGLTCRVVANNRIVFNAKGNDYRLIAAVLNRVRPLTLEMIRRLASGLNLPADVLIRPMN